MIRAVLLAIGKEFRLLRRDPVGLFMLLVAPVAVIAAAGFSLANVYGGAPSTTYAIAVADEDHGQIGRVVTQALRDSKALSVIDAPDGREAERLVREGKRAIVVAIVIPAGTTAAIENGALRSPRLMVYSDPVRYLETVKVELALGEVCRRINIASNDQARLKLEAARARLGREIWEASRAADQARTAAEKLAHNAQHSSAAAEGQIRRQIDAAIANAKAQTETALNDAIAQLSSQAQAQVASQRALIGQTRDYLQSLKKTESSFQEWLAELKQLAGSRASNIPPPPAFPEPPRELLALNDSQPQAPDFAAIRSRLDKSIVMPDIHIQMPTDLAPGPLPEIPKISIDGPLGSESIPGVLGFSVRDITGNEVGPLSGFNAFDLQVPGFAVTFLLIGMLMGVSLALIDERDWGTLDRLRAAAAPLGATFAGKLLARFTVGFLQMAVLFAAGWVFFGISLGRSPWALALPSASIAFAGAAFGLVIAGIGRTRDAVMPVGAIVIMTMAAIGGCWWPIDFEPHWMQTAALGIPTTWAMRAFNDLMIRRLPASSALLPCAVNLAFGFVYMFVGIAITRRRFARDAG
ncbi:MAG: ABC transporter permease [Candidatus Binataceae bacterium]